MEDMQAAAATSPFSVASVLNRSWRTLWKVPGVGFGLMLVVALLNCGLTLLLAGSPLTEPLVLMVDGVLSLALSGAIAYAVFQELSGRHAGLGESVSRGLVRFLPLFLASLLAALGTMAGMVLLLVPGLILSCMWSVIVPVCVVERLGPIETLSRSAELTKGYRWPILGLTVIVAVLGLALASSIEALFGALGGDTATSSIVGILVSILPATFQNVMLAIAYYELRAIKEGLTIDSLISVFD